MKRDDLYDLAAFAVVAEQGSFTRAAAELGMSQSALSHAMKALEERLGVRLLSRTTRSVSTTEAGETLLRSLRPALADIASGVDGSAPFAGSRPAPSESLRPSMRSRPSSCLSCQVSLRHIPISGWI
jgi:DNA-binding transcriptional LysR family regulator